MTITDANRAGLNNLNHMKDHILHIIPENVPFSRIKHFQNFEGGGEAIGVYFDGKAAPVYYFPDQVTEYDAEFGKGDYDRNFLREVANSSALLVDAARGYAGEKWTDHIPVQYGRGHRE